MATKTVATIDTNKGQIQVELFPNHAPKTVRNFVGLATGDIEWTDPATGKKRNDPLYQNVIFHRIIQGFMLQGGDPLGQGTGGPGYQFADEIHPELSFDRPYLLAMANAGPNTNGSQFFIVTAEATPWLDGNHTNFGRVTAGQDVVEAIGTTATGANDRPVEEQRINAVTIEVA